MRLALLGYGQMGKAIEQIALDNDHQIVLITNKDTDLNKKKINNLSIDVAIEFSTPDAAFDNISYCLENKITVISGTTGWLNRLHDAERLAILNNGTFLHASNFSLGVNIFFNINKRLAKLLAKSNYTPKIEETHHSRKKDAPSGTAITLAEEIIKENAKFTEWVNTSANSDNQLSIKSKREAETPGIHKVTYKGIYDDIIIEHKANTRQGFAVGVLAVAEWIKDKRGVFSMNDFMDS